MDEETLAAALNRLGKNVKHARIELDMTQEDAALEAGLTRGNWSKLERGQLNPSARTVVKVASALQTTASELFRDVGHATG